MPHSPVIAGSVSLMILVGAVSVLALPASGETAQRAQARLDAIPLDLPPWKGEAVPPTERWSKSMRVAQAEAHMYRVYTHTATKATVSVLILYGRQGEMCAHDPNTCYTGSGYTTNGRQPLVKEFPTARSALWRSRFEKTEPASEGLDVCWGFATADGRWAAPAAPRRDYVLYGRLYKVYAQRSAPSPPAAGGADPLHEFLTAFLPTTTAALTAE